MQSCSHPGGRIFDQNLKFGSADPEPESGLADLRPACGPSETSLQFGSRLTQEAKSGSEETRTLQPGSGLLQRPEGPGGGLQPETGPEDTSQAESRPDLEVDSDDPADLWSEFQLDLKIESSSDSEETRTQRSGSRSPEDADLESEPRDLPSVSRPTESGDLLTHSRPEETREPSAGGPGSRLDQPGWRSRDLDLEPPPGGCGSTCGSEHAGERCPRWAPTTTLPPGPRSLHSRARFQQGSGSGVRPESGSVQTGSGDSDCRLAGSRIPLLPLLTSRVDLKPVLRPEETTGPGHGPRLDLRPGPEPRVQEASMLDIRWDSGSGPDARSDVDLRPSDQPRSTLDPEPERNTDLETVPTSPETPGPPSALQPGRSRNVHSERERERELDPGSAEEHRPREDSGHTPTHVLHPQVPEIQPSGPGPEVIWTTPPEDHPANHRRELLSSWEHLLEEVTARLYCC